MLVAATGLIAGVALVARAARGARGRPDTAAGTLRVHAEVHTGIEQALIGITRTLSLVGAPGDAAYGQMFVQQTDHRHLLIGSRSEIGRGFRAVLALERGRNRTVVDYSIVRLPGDESLHAAVLQFELLLIEALRRLDADVDVRLVGTALRDLERARPLPGPPSREA